jgi:Ca2+-binding RTX toxin-like protein
MTTYSINGVQVERDIDDNVINVTDVALELVFAPNSTPIVSYSIDADNPPTDDEPLPLVDIDGAGIIGATIGDINLADDANDFDDYFGFVDHSGGRSHILNFTDRPVGAAATDYIFVFGGDALPDVVASNDPVAAWLALEDSITNLGQSSSPFGPGDEILVADVPDVNITENDVILGNAYDQTLDGGIGNDKIYGEGGDDTLIGGDGNDTLYGGGGENEMSGGAGDDLFIVDADSEGDYIALGLGNDTVDLTNMSEWAHIFNEESENAATFTLNMANNTGSISTGSDGTATLLGVESTDNIYLGTFADSKDDVFNITQVEGGWGWVGLYGRGGNDTFNLGSSTGGIVRIDLNSYVTDSTIGNNVNLTTGTISNALGGTDTITGQDAVKIELRGSMVNDTILGSDRDERFILLAGDDTLDAGGGQDLLRYDRSGVDAVTVDLSAGTASGVWRGEAFSHSITGIEEVRGSRQGDDVITGSDAAERFEGLGGDDTIVGGGGDDTVGFKADRSAATVTDLGNGQVQIASDDGTDVISGVENFAFNDGTVNLATLLGNVSDSGSTTITFVGTENDFIGTAFLDDDNNTSVDIVSNTGTQLVLKNSATGYTSTLIGTGITFSGAAGEEVPTAGSITSISIVDGDGVAQGTITDINWDLVEFSDALDAVADNDNVAPLADLFSSNGTLTVDGSGAMVDFYLDDLLGSDITTLLTQPMDVIGSGGDDSLIGGAGADYIEAGGGNDTIDASIGAASSQNWGDYIKPGAGTNTIIGHQDLFEVSNDGLDIGYQDVSNSGGIILTVGENGSGTAVSNTAGVVNDTFTYAHRFDGTHQNDRFEGSANSNWEGWGGNGGDDTINAGEGYDELLYHFDSKRGGSGAVAVNFKTGTATDGFGDTDTFTGIEAVRGTAQNDVFIGSEALSFISYRGLDGNDTITGSTAWDRADYSKDANYGGSGAITADLSAGTILDGFGTTDQVSDIDQVRGTDQGDSMTAAGLQQGIQFEGRDGNDTLTGGGGDDTIYGGNDFDTISAGEGNDEVHGGNGQDLIFLNQGDDLFIDNGQGGELGRDTVFTGLGNDTVQGGNGDDVFFGEDGNDVINARLGNDTIYGGNNFDTISAGEGNDEVHGGNGRDLIFLNQGDDIYYDNGQGGELGRDTVYTGLGNDTVEGGNGDDVFFGEDGNDVINARLGNDTVYGGNNFDTISAGAGNDKVLGGNGRDLIFLGEGNDLYIDTAQAGTLGQDTINGGPGADTFVFGLDISNDVIVDFEPGVDFLRFDNLLTQGFSASELMLNLTEVTSDGVLIGFGAGNSLLLENLTSATELASDIEFF